MRKLGVLVALVAGLTACTGGSDPDPGRSAVPRQMDVDRDTTVVKPAWTLKGVEPIGQPVVVHEGDRSVAVVIAKDTARRLQIMGVDAADGKRLWSHRFSPSQALPGYSVMPVTSRTDDGQERVIFHRAAKEPGVDGVDDLLTPVVSVDPVSGEIEARSEPVMSSQPPTRCEDGTDACLPGNFDGSEREVSLRFDIDGGDIDEDDEGAPRNARLIGDAGLFSTDARPGEKLGVQRNGKTLWTRSLEKLVGKGYSTDGGWAFIRESRPDRYTGFVGEAYDDDSIAPVSFSTEKNVVDLSRSVMVSFKGSNGEVLWTRKGVEMCYGRAYGDDEETIPIEEHPYRCQVKGTLTFEDGATDPEVDGVVASIQGYEPKSGKTTWSHRLSTSAATEIRDPTHGVVTRNSDRLVVDLREGLAIVDVRTGKLAPASGPTFLCQTEPEEFPYAQPWGESGIFTRYGAGMMFACTPDGESVDSGMTVAALNEGAEKVTDTSFVLASEDGVVGYQVDDG